MSRLLRKQSLKPAKLEVFFSLKFLSLLRKARLIAFFRADLVEKEGFLQLHEQLLAQGSDCLLVNQSPLSALFYKLESPGLHFMKKGRLYVISFKEFPLFLSLVENALFRSYFLGLYFEGNFLNLTWFENPLSHLESLYKNRVGNLIQLSLFFNSLLLSLFIYTLSLLTTFCSLLMIKIQIGAAS